MASKDIWDKLDIICKILILGIIPITISLGTNNIAQSMKRGELIQSLIKDLSEQKTKQDIALIALDDAMPLYLRNCKVLGKWKCENNLEQDPVIQIAGVLINTSIDEALEKEQFPKELEVAKKIISSPKRGSEKFYEDNFGSRIKILQVNSQPKARSQSQGKPTPAKVKEQANISETIAAIQPSSDSLNIALQDIRLVYIQYESNKELAEQIQKSLQDQGISAPAIEYVKGIKENNIRYANPVEKAIADSLQTYLQDQQNIQFGEAIDLSKAGYKVASGQFEVWLK